MFLGAAGCTDIRIENEPPIAVAGDDRSLEGTPSVRVKLDGRGSHDPDGTIAAYEWRYTGDPRGAGDADGGVDDPIAALLQPLPAFCPAPDPKSEEVVPARWCELERAGKPVVEVELDTGVWRFTLWVTDDDGAVAADSLVVSVNQ